MKTSVNTPVSPEQSPVSTRRWKLYALLGILLAVCLLVLVGLIALFGITHDHVNQIEWPIAATQAPQSPGCSSPGNSGAICVPSPHV